MWIYGWFCRNVELSVAFPISEYMGDFDAMLIKRNTSYFRLSVSELMTVMTRIVNVIVWCHCRLAVVTDLLQSVHMR